MMPIRRVALTLVTLVLTCAVGACSSSDDDAPPETDVIGSAVVVDPDAAVTTDAVPTGSAPVPATGIGSIDGPATVDPEFGGANPGGADTGG
jgi:hypothetical protein